MDIHPVLELLKYTIPSLVVFFTAFFAIRYFLKNEEKRIKYEVFINHQKSLLPMRLQAYERASLFLERISPDSLLKRFHTKGMTAGELHSKLLTAIRTEFEHNFSQQIYMSHQAWQMIVKAKENTVKIINTQASNIKPDVSAILLSKAILEEYIAIEKSPSQIALEYIKNEVRQLFL